METALTGGKINSRRKMRENGNYYQAREIRQTLFKKAKPANQRSHKGAKWWNQLFFLPFSQLLALSREQFHCKMVNLAVVLENHSYANGEFKLVASNEFRESKLKYLIKQKQFLKGHFLTISKNNKKGHVALKLQELIFKKQTGYTIASATWCGHHHMHGHNHIIWAVAAMA